MKEKIEKELALAKDVDDLPYLEPGDMSELKKLDELEKEELKLFSSNFETMLEKEKTLLKQENYRGFINAKVNHIVELMENNLLSDDAYSEICDAIAEKMDIETGQVYMSTSLNSIPPCL
jgi:hypothetical protein